MIAYKLTNQAQKSLVIHGEGTVEYVVGKTTTPAPNCGPLAVFDTLRSACLFYYGTKRVFKCRIKKSQLKTLWHPWGNDYYEFPGDRKGRTDRMHHSDMPPGTILADRVTLLEEVT